MSSPTKKILIVENEYPIIHALQLKLAKEGLTSDSAKNGKEALKLIQKNSYALILLDLMMPEVDGFQFLERLKPLQMKTPIAIVSNLSQDEDVKRAKDLGAFHYFVKSKTSLKKIVQFIKNTLN